MTANAFYEIFTLSFDLPFIAIGLVLCHYCLLRLRWRLFRRGFCPSALALGMALQFMQVFHRPSMAHVLEVKQEEDADEDDQGAQTLRTSICTGNSGAFGAANT
jgi:hypothetical protein